MTVRDQLALRVPEADVDVYEAHIMEKRGQKRPYAGMWVERELWTLKEANDLADLEDEIDRILRSIGKRPIDMADSHEKNILTRSTSTGPTRVVNYRVHPEVREWFVNNHDNPGRVLGRLMRYIADGGTVEQLLERVRRMADDVELILSELDTDADADGELNTKERRTIQIAKILTEDTAVFDRDDFRNALPKVRGLSDSEHCRDEYLPRVRDYLDYDEHPDNPDVFVPEQRRREIAAEKGIDPDAPAIDRKSYDDLSPDEKVRGVRIELLRRAKKNKGRFQFDAGAIKTDVFDGYPSDGNVQKLMDTASAADGFSTRKKHGKRHVTVDRSKVTDDDLLSVVADSERDAAVAQLDAVTNPDHAVTDGGGS